MNSKAKDVALILIAAGMLVAVFIPAGESSQEDASADEQASETATDGKKKASSPNLNVVPKPMPMETACAAPAKDTPHPLFPLVAGSTWVYRVTGPPKYAPDEQWTLKIKSVPSDDGPGILEVGYGNKLNEAKIWMQKGTVRMAGLPLSEPIQFLGNKPTDVSGALLNVAAGFIKGGVWELNYERDITHRYRNDRGKLVEVAAKGYQKERAEVEEFEDITVPAGRFNAHRIFWLSRFEIKIKGRPILDRLTGEPYRKEIMWVAPGIGIVKRKIEYSGVRAGRFSFDLVRYTRPE